MIPSWRTVHVKNMELSTLDQEPGRAECIRQLFSIMNTKIQQYYTFPHEEAYKTKYIDVGRVIRNKFKNILINKPPTTSSNV